MHIPSDHCLCMNGGQLDHLSPLSELPSELKAMAPEYQPKNQRQALHETQQRQTSIPLVTPELAQAPSCAKPSVEDQDHPRDNAVESGSALEPEVDVIPVSEPVGEVDHPLKKSTCPVKLQSVFIYNQIRKPTCQTWSMGANAMYAWVPYSVSSCSVGLDRSYHPSPAVWTY